MERNGTSAETTTPSTAALVAALWFLFASLELALALLLPESVLRRPLLSLQARLSLVALNLVALAALLSIVVPVFFVTVSRLTRLALFRIGVARWVGRRLVELGVAIALLLYAGSWASFWVTGYFLDSEGSAFFAANPLQLLQHAADMMPLQSAIFPFVLLTMTLALCHVFVPWAAACSRTTHRRMIRGAGVALGVCALAAAAGHAHAGRNGKEVVDPETGVPYRESEIYRFVRDYKTGPALRLAANFLEPLFAGQEVLAKSTLSVSRPLRISLQTYLDSVDRSRVRRLNVVTIFVESLRPDELVAFGGRREVMPNVEALARESVLFTRGYTQASHSNFADLCPLNSHYPLQSGELEGENLPPAYPHVFIYDILKPLGWRTAIFSSQNENWGGMAEQLDNGSLDRFLHAETFDGPTYVPSDDWGFADWVRGEKHAGKIDDRFTVNEAATWINQVKDEPFFMHVNFQNSHVPYSVPADFPRKFGPEKVDFTIAFRKFPRNKIGVVRDVYSDSLAYVDAQIATLFRALKSAGVWDSTVIILTADNGQAFFEHGFASHGSYVYDEVMRVPLIVRAPGLAPSVDERLSQHIDVPPTILGLLGLPPHPSFQGLDLLAPPPPERSVHLLSQTSFAHQSAIVRANWKLMYDERLRKYTLYDLEADPGETRDLANLRPDMVHELEERLQVWRQEQIGYYRSLERQAREFPPVVQD